MSQTVRVTEHKSPAERMLDTLVFAPLGLVTEARSLVPDLAAKGRIRVANARMLGQFAVTLGSAEAGKRVGDVSTHIRSVMVGFGLAPPEFTEEQDAPPVQAAPARRKPAGKTVAARKPAEVITPIKVVRESAVPDEADLAIPGYGSLAASQVVSRLAGMRPGELDDVKRYEMHHRGRKTILGKIAQLQAS